MSTDFDDSIFANPQQIIGRDEDIHYLVGHLAPLDKAIPQVLLLTADGGVGKTTMLKAIVDHYRNQRPILDIYDFFHIEKFQASKIEDHIRAALIHHDSDCTGIFQLYDEERRKLEHLREQGPGFEEQQTHIRKTFVDCFNTAAQLLAARQQTPLLIFDTVEQAQNLTDAAERTLIKRQRTASDGGAAWLMETVPQLKFTSILLSGRPYSLYVPKQHIEKEPVALYAHLTQAHEREEIALFPYPLAGLSKEALRKYTSVIQRRHQESPSATLRELVQYVDLSDENLTVWHAISGGIPLWIAWLFTQDMIAGEFSGTVTDTLRQRLRNGEMIELTSDQRLAYQKELVSYLLRDVEDINSPLLTMLQWLAVIRKGLSLSLLKKLIELQGLSSLLPDPEGLFEQLKQLVVVKDLVVPAELTVSGEPEVHLFLHDEMYIYLEEFSTTIIALKQSLLQDCIAIHQATVHELYVQQAHAVGTAQHDESQSWQKRRRIHQRIQHLQLDLVGYHYLEGVAQGLNIYNILAHMSLFLREAGFNLALRQEGLRNMYRLAGEIPRDIELECAARWILRATYLGNYELAEQYIQQAQQYYADDLQNNHSISTGYLYYAMATNYIHNKRIREQGRFYLDETMQISNNPDITEIGEWYRLFGPAFQTIEWFKLFMMLAKNLEGFDYRLQDLHAEALDSYRSALFYRIKLSPYHYVLELFRGIILTNMSFILSEQGESARSFEISKEAYRCLQHYGLESDIAYNRNALARSRIRAGDYVQAQRYAFRARKIFTRINHSRGLNVCIPVIAEAYRKLAEQDADHEGDPMTLFKDSLRELRDLEVSPHSPQDKKELYQNMGCTYRSMGRVIKEMLMEQHFHGHTIHDTPSTLIEQMNDYFKLARCYLQRALAYACHLKISTPDIVEISTPDIVKIYISDITAYIASKKLEVTENFLSIMDILEDLIVVEVNADSYTPTIDHYIKAFEVVTPTQYPLKIGVGFESIQKPTKGYWRELGQLELQRMLVAFGKYDFPSEGDSPPLEVAAEAAAAHMLFCLAYLYQYDSQSLIVARTEYLFLRELRHPSAPRPRAVLQSMRMSTYRAAEEYNLLRSPAHQRLEHLLQQAEEDNRFLYQL